MPVVTGIICLAAGFGVGWAARCALVRHRVRWYAAVLEQAQRRESLAERLKDAYGQAWTDN
jgi:hypothetical protein